MSEVFPGELSPELIDRLVAPTPLASEELEAQYPPRDLDSNAEVTRIAPSPTGLIHIGALYTALISQRLARQTNGVFYLRIEDTDRSREVDGAKDLIMKSLADFGLDYDEGPFSTGDEAGRYGPYVQSERQLIYDAFTRRLLRSRKAYPCFMSPDAYQSMSHRQAELKIRPGYYGEWAEWRDKPERDIEQALDAGLPYTIRFKSPGVAGRRICINDVVKGRKELPENDNDIVIRKRDGLPTYHLAHVIDDYLMRTSTVVRGDEWLSSCPLHVQLSEAIGVKPFKYAHIATIQKMDGNSRRKLSKRRDPEANVDYYLRNGYPTNAVTEYLLNQANSTFEYWRKANPESPNTRFVFDIGKLPRNSGALLNQDKMDSVSKDVLGMLSAEETYEDAVKWATHYDADLAECMQENREYTVQVFGVEKNSKRKDMTKFIDIRNRYGYFFDKLFEQALESDNGLWQLSGISLEDRVSIAQDFLKNYHEHMTEEEWFDAVKKAGLRAGFAPSVKEYRANKESFKGSVADVAMVLRVAVTGRTQSPNLSEIMSVLGEERVRQRIGRLAVL